MSYLLFRYILTKTLPIDLLGHLSLFLFPLFPLYLSLTEACGYALLSESKQHDHQELVIFFDH